MYAITPDMLEMMWAGAFMALKALGVTFLWCIAAGIINKGVGG